MIVAFILVYYFKTEVAIQPECDIGKVYVHYITDFLKMAQHTFNTFMITTRM